MKIKLLNNNNIIMKEETLKRIEKLKILLNNCDISKRIEILIIILYNILILNDKNLFNKIQKEMKYTTKIENVIINKLSLTEPKYIIDNNRNILNSLKLKLDITQFEKEFLLPKHLKYLPNLIELRLSKLYCDEYDNINNEIPKYLKYIPNLLILEICIYNIYFR